MRIAVTGATGFLGRYLIQELTAAGHVCRCWTRNPENLPSTSSNVEWISGNLNDTASHASLVTNCDAIVHAALYRAGDSFRGGEGDLLPFVETNLLGTLRLIEAAREKNLRFVFISTCAVHEEIHEDRPLDETHPTTPRTHYGAHKAAIEQFIQSFGCGSGYPICALRPTGIYGLARPVEKSKWFSLIKNVMCGGPVDCRRGGKEVHAADVAKAALLLLNSADINGQIFNCCDRYISEFDVAHVTADLTGSKSSIKGDPKQPRHTINTNKIERLGMQFGGKTQLRKTVGEIVESITKTSAAD